MRDTPYDGVMIARFRKDPEYAIQLLNSILNDGDQEEFMDFLPLITAALNPTQPPTTPLTLLATLRSLGLRLSLEPLSQGEHITLEEMTESMERVEKEEAVGV